MLLERFLQEYEQQCINKGYSEFQRLNIAEAVRLIQDVGYLSDPQKTDQNGPPISIIEENCLTEMWRYLTAYSE